MKRTLRTAIALVMAMLMVFQTPAQVLADETGPDYISEVRIGMGKDAESYLTGEGFTILKDENGKPVDLNKDAGGGWGSEGDVKVLMGYKTTKDRSEAITDLAVMNMEGGYDVQEYEALIQQRMDSQIIPLVQKLQATIDEYRANLQSSDPANRQRAEYIRTALNKFTDDDCGGAGLGDLLLNPTKFEMGDAAYDKLTEDEKKQHCDITTLFLQADGQVMLLIYDLLTRAADTSEDSWMDRFSGMSYDDLIDSYGMSPTDAKKQAAKDFEDDARILLQSWGALREQLIGANDAAEKIEKMEVTAYEPKLEGLNENSDPEAVVEAVTDLLEAQEQQTEMIELAASVTVADYLESIEYGDGTMYDFFTQSSTDVEKNIKQLYPLVASLSEGQRAGMEFISLRELVMLSNRDMEYSDESLEDIAPASVYEGVDRGIYEKGGVALTWDAKRTEAMEAEKNNGNKGIMEILSTKTIVLWCLTGAVALDFVISAAVTGTRGFRLLMQNSKAATLSTAKNTVQGDMAAGGILDDVFDQSVAKAEMDKLVDDLLKKGSNSNTTNTVNALAASTKAAAWMSAGFAVAMVILAGISTYLTWRDLKAYYDVDYAVIPHYMVDETAITYYNANNEKMVKENHAAYYKAVSCNRSVKADTYEAMDDCADLNGDVGQQWLALYACKNNKVMQPILADSLKAVVKSTEIPAGYTTGIHMFGQETAFNLNNVNYDWNQSAPKIFVYFKIDTEAPAAATSGSAFSGGWIALAAVAGIAVGAVGAALTMTSIKKKKEDAAAV